MTALYPGAPLTPTVTALYPGAPPTPSATAQRHLQQYRTSAAPTSAEAERHALVTTEASLTL